MSGTASESPQPREATVPARSDVPGIDVPLRRSGPYDGDLTEGDEGIDDPPEPA